MCATDLELEHDAAITEDEPMLDEAQVIGQHPGVAWGLAGPRHQDPAEGPPGAGTR